MKKDTGQVLSIFFSLRLVRVFSKSETMSSWEVQPEKPRFQTITLGGTSALLRTGFSFLRDKLLTPLLPLDTCLLPGLFSSLKNELCPGSSAASAGRLMTSDLKEVVRRLGVGGGGGWPGASNGP